MAESVAVMRSGVIVQHGPPQDVYRRPADLWVANFVGRANIVPGRARGGGRVETALGALDVVGGPAEGPVDVVIRPGAAPALGRRRRHGGGPPVLRPRRRRRRGAGRRRAAAGPAAQRRSHARGQRRVGVVPGAGPGLPVGDAVAVAVRTAPAPVDEQVGRGAGQAWWLVPPAVLAVLGALAGGAALRLLVRRAVHGRGGAPAVAPAGRGAGQRRRHHRLPARRPAVVQRPVLRRDPPVAGADPVRPRRGRPAPALAGLRRRRRAPCSPGPSGG